MTEAAASNVRVPPGLRKQTYDMKRFLGFVRKEFLHIFRDGRTILILFGIPVVQLLLFGTVITNEIKDVRIAVVDRSKDAVTKEITTKLLSSGYFLIDPQTEDITDIEAVFRKGKVKEVVVFEAGFAEKLRREGSADMQLILDASEPNTARLLAAYTTGIVNDYLFKAGDTGLQPRGIQPEVRMYYNEQLRSVYMFVPGIMTLILMLISAMMTSISITREKELGTMEVLLASPLHPVQIIMGKITPYLGLSVINAIVILSMGHLVFGVPITGSPLLLLATTTLFIMMALCLGILISTMAKTQMTAMFISMIGLMLPTMLLSGFIFPIENMPVILQVVSNVMPARWFIVILKSIMLQGTGFLFIWKEVLVLVVMSLLFVAVAVKKFKVRLE